MRLLLTFALCSWTALAQTNQDADSNMSCVERLQMPAYPPLAAAARISGKLAVTVAISPGGAIQKASVDVELGTVNAKLLVPAVETALRASAFRSDCSGKSVRLIFNFGFDSDQGKAVSFGYPNKFWISVPPPIQIFN
jgi:hypothetical protein